MTTFFVTATGTGVGKTHVTVELIRALHGAGRRVRALKPVATGFDASRPEDSDSARLLEALGRPLDEHGLDAVTPWRFSAPLSPDMAAAREGRIVDWRRLLDLCRAPVGQPAAEVTLIEGIGGVMVPLDERHTVLDWIAALDDTRVLLVAGSYLGTLSHTLTAAGMLAARGCRVEGIVVDESVEQPVPPEDTAGTLRRFVSTVPVVVVPRAERAAAKADPLLRLLENWL